MGELLTLATARARMVRWAAREFLTGSRLRIAVVLSLVAVFWVLMFTMFLEGFTFLRGFRAICDIVTRYLFAFFFVSLMVMMTLSDAIIAYTSLYHSEETEFLFALPVRPVNTFVYRSADSAVFSAWGMLTLVLPMILAYGIVFPVPAYFYPIALLLAGLLTVLATELGALAAVATALLLPRRRKTALTALGAAGILLVGAWLWRLWWHRPKELFSEAGLRSVISGIAFCQHWALPSHWVSYGMLAAAKGNLRAGMFFVLMLLSNVLFVGLVAARFGHYAFRGTWQAVQGSPSGRRRAVGSAGDWPSWVPLPLPRKLRLLVAKDMKTFLRDPSQWSQFLLFFGLLALYVVNLPHLGLGDFGPYWHSKVAVLNLGATCLTLATLTSRFVFPQLSLEGRRIWIVGLLPMRRSLVLWGKFVFAAAGTFVVSGALVTLSGVFLALPAWATLVHLAVVFCVCCGLNGLAVGLGALYPTLGTDNPSRIVSSFGGTLNLICSICLIVVTLAPVAALMHMKEVGALSGGAFGLWLAATLGFVVCVSAVACVGPMVAGVRAFDRMEF